MSDKNEEKLKRLLTAMSDKSLTEDSFVEAFNMVLDHIASFQDATVGDLAKIFDRLDEFSNQLKTDNESERSQVKQMVGAAIADLRIKLDARFAEKEIAVEKRLSEFKDGKDADESRVIQSVLSQLPVVKDGVDGSPDTPDQIIGKINQSELTINTERVTGLVDYIRMAAQNAASSMPVTTAFYNGLRGKNLTIVGATARQVGDTVQITVSGAGGGQVNSVVAGTGISVDSTDPANPIVSATGGSSGITIGTTTITSGTDTRILYNNAGVVGEYTLTGSGTVVAMATAPTFATSITGSYLTASEILITDGSKNIVSAPVATYPSLTELTYLKGVTSAIQTQINAKGAGTVTTVGFTGGLISVANATTTPALTVAGTSGGIPYFSSGTTWATSAALAANAIVIGGGAGAAPATTTTGTGVLTALGINVGSAGAFVTFNGALGTPSSGTVTNLTGTASININGTVGATTPTTGVFTTLVAGSTTSLLLGTAGSAVGNIGFRNATSGTITLAPVTGALGTVTLTLPARTDTLVTLGGTETLTAKTLTSPTITTATLSGAQQLAEGASIRLDQTLSADGTFSGTTIAGTAGATLAFGDLIYLAVADSRWELVDADSVTTAGAVLTGFCVLAAAADGDPTVILLDGNIRADTAFPALTVGAPVYASTTAGDIQVAQPSGTDDVIQVVGFALTADSIVVRISPDYITHT